MKLQSLPNNVGRKNIWWLSGQAWNLKNCVQIAAKQFWHISLLYREVPEKDAKDYADSIHAIFVETSAKNAININEVFVEISECVSWAF